MSEPHISILVPSRGRTDILRRFLDSIAEMADQPDTLEVILGVDDDDLESCAFTYDRLAINKVVFPAGMTMGFLNQTCFEHSRGRVIAPMNDDLIIRTRGFDTFILEQTARFPDEVYLLYSNDGIFEEKLCTFPILSRRVCEEVGFCPTVYRRYKIDDHIFNTFNLLASLGHRRMYYLKDMNFEHDNFDEPLPTDEYFTSRSGKAYVTDQVKIKEDHESFLELFDQRKKNALRLSNMITAYEHQEEQQAAASKLESFHDSYGVNNLEYVSQISITEPTDRKDVTVVVVTADIYSKHASACISSVKKYTKGSELIVMDNSGNINFSHPVEMNRAMRLCKTRFIALLDDDVIVHKGWLNGLLEAFKDPKVGAATPLHFDASDRLSYAGPYFSGDGCGGHGHALEIPRDIEPVMTHCSACLLIDMTRCGHIPMDEQYQKYYFDTVHGFQIWEAGYKSVICPSSTVIHLGGATAEQRSSESLKKNYEDRALFTSLWEETGRLKQLADNQWMHIEKFSYFFALYERAHKLISEVNTAAPTNWCARVSEWVDEAKSWPLIAGAFAVNTIKALTTTDPQILRFIESLTLSLRLDPYLISSSEFTVRLFRIRAVLRGIKNIVLYGAGKHTMRFIDALSTVDEPRIVSILDDNPTRDNLNGIPIMTMDALTNLTMPIDAIVISSDTCEIKILQSILRQRDPGYPIFGLYEPAKVNACIQLRRRLQRDNVIQYALYGAGKHTSALLTCLEGTSVQLPTLIVDDTPQVQKIMGIPIIPMTDISQHDVDLLVLSTDTWEMDMAKKLIHDKFSGSVHSLYLDGKFGRIVELAARLRENKPASIALYGTGKHIRDILDCFEGAALPPLKVIVDDTPTIQEINGIPVVALSQLSDYDFETLVLSFNEPEHLMLKKLAQVRFSRPVISMYSLSSIQPVC